ncbi:MAG: TetR/AcrR family transcriptional regulator [Acidobacteriota bacterium]|nr:TetR/AcrR family transcriptional regulator [Acidobacteriota bacterium]
MSPARPPRARGPKPHKVEADQLLDAAQVVFAREGLRSASLRAIAREAGCDPALIYYHFDSKEAMLTALLDRRVPPLVEALKGIADPSDLRPTPLRLWSVMGAFHRHLSHDPGFRSLIRGEIVRGAEGIQARIQTYLGGAAREVRSVLEQGVVRGEVRHDLPPFLATFCLVRLHLEILDLLPVVAPQILGPEERPDLAAAERTWLQFYWRSLAADPAAPCPPLPAFDA